MKLSGVGALFAFFLIALAVTLGYLTAEWLAPKVGLRTSG